VLLERHIIVISVNSSLLLKCLKAAHQLQKTKQNIKKPKKVSNTTLVLNILLKYLNSALLLVTFPSGFWDEHFKHFIGHKNAEVLKLEFISVTDLIFVSVSIFLIKWSMPCLGGLVY
jgi:hypothetical protein